MNRENTKENRVKNRVRPYFIYIYIKQLYQKAKTGSEPIFSCFLSCADGKAVFCELQKTTLYRDGY